MKIYVNDLQGYANCVHHSIWGKPLFSCYDSFRNITYEFESGNTYGIVSDFSDGCWGLVSTLAGYGVLTNGNIYIDNSVIHCKKLKDYACLIGEPLPSKYLKLSPEKIIHQITRNKTNFENSIDLQKTFLLSMERFNRPVLYGGIEIWKTSILYGYLTGKKVFAFPWMSEKDLWWVESLKPVLNYLKKKGGIILIPTSHYNKICKHCDRIIDWRLPSIEDDYKNSI